MLVREDGQRSVPSQVLQHGPRPVPAEDFYPEVSATAVDQRCDTGVGGVTGHDGDIDALGGEAGGPRLPVAEVGAQDDGALASRERLAEDLHALECADPHDALVSEGGHLEQLEEHLRDALAGSPDDPPSIASRELLPEGGDEILVSQPAAAAGGGVNEEAPQVADGLHPAEGQRPHDGRQREGRHA